LATDLLVGHGHGRDGRKKLEHASGEAERFYRQLPAPALIGWSRPETASGLWNWPRRWAHLWIGDAAKIRACEVRAQKHDRRDAALIPKLLLEGRFRESGHVR